MPTKKVFKVELDETNSALNKVCPNFECLLELNEEILINKFIIKYIILSKKKFLSYWKKSTFYAFKKWKKF